MAFEPKTTIYFCRTGIDDYNKVSCSTQEELQGLITKSGNLQGTLTESSFQRADGQMYIRVDHKIIAYYNLIQCDTVMYQNMEETAAFWIVGNITSVEWKNPDVSFVYFKIDHFMTYQPFINWARSYALIEREHVHDDWASADGNPLFSNIGPAEDFGTMADVPFYTWEKHYSTDFVLVQSPYDKDSAEPTFKGTVKGGLFTSLENLAGDPTAANNFFNKVAEKKEASINNIVGVYGYPKDWAKAIVTGGTEEENERLEAINIAALKNPSNIKYNNAKCWSAPFCVIRLFSSEGDSKDFTPQWFGNDTSDYEMRFLVTGAGGQFGGAAATFVNKNNTFNWKTWADFVVMIKNLPSCPWTGDGFTDWASVNQAATYANGINGMVRGVGDVMQRGMSGNKFAAATGFVEGVTNTVAEGLNIAATINQQKSSGAAVKGVGSLAPLFDIAQEAWGFKVVYYGTQPYMMLCVDSYFDRFGYRQNRTKRIELESRPIWNFIKTAECHVVANTGVPWTSEKAINDMFNHGVTMWNRKKYMSGRKIGDFSNPAENRGIQGWTP